MDDTISRQAVVDAIKKAYWDSNLQSANDDPCVIDAMTDWSIRQIKALPTIDAVEVVRCRECIHCYVDGENVRFNCCELNHNKVQSDDWFCADGERKSE